MELLGDAWQKASYVVVAGGGGNGGGICAARHLANHGCRVTLCLADPEHLGELPAFQRKVFRSTSGKEITNAQLDGERPDVILDAVIGYGLRSAPRGRGCAADWVGKFARCSNSRSRYSFRTECHNRRRSRRVHLAGLDHDGAAQNWPAAWQDRRIVSVRH